MRGRSAAVLATFAIGTLAAVGAANLGLLSSDPASGEFGQLVAPPQTETPATSAIGRAVLEPSLAGSSLVGSTTVAPSVDPSIAPVLATLATEPAKKTPNAALPAVTMPPLVSVAGNTSTSVEPEEREHDERHDETSAPRTRRAHDTRPSEEREHEEDDDD